MSIRKFVYSYFEEAELDPIILSLNSARRDTDFSIGVKTVDGSDYQIDVGDGNIVTQQSNTIPRNYTLPLSFSGDTKIYTKRDNIEELKFTTSTSHDFLLADLFGMSNLKVLFLTEKVTGKIANIPNSVDTFVMLQGSSIINGYSIRRDFTFVPMKNFTLVNSSGTGLTSSEVDNLLEDLSQATWTGTKRVQITGVHEPRTSASDAFVTTLQNKGVTVITNT